jgi:hypothetical protein
MPQDLRALHLEVFTVPSCLTAFAKSSPVKSGFFLNALTSIQDG